MSNSQRIVNHLEQALQAAHRAKMALQSFSMTAQDISAAEMLLFDLRQTIESLEGQLHVERKQYAKSE